MRLEAPSVREEHNRRWAFCQERVVLGIRLEVDQPRVGVCRVVLVDQVSEVRFGPAFKAVDFHSLLVDEEGRRVCRLENAHQVHLRLVVDLGEAERRQLARRSLQRLTLYSICSMLLN